MSKKLPSEIQSGILEILNEKSEFYSMKELETLGREKGITKNAAKDMVLRLVAQNTVETAKIGINSYYWTLHKSDTTAKKAKVDELKALNKTLDEKLKNLVKKQQSKNESQEVISSQDALKREQLSAEMKELALKLNELQGVKKVLLETSSESSENEKIEQNTKPLVNAVNRWTDNIYNSIDFTKKKLNLEDTKQIYKECNIPQNLDYVE
jgi:hypothetical protein